jgi:hypothetical protein
MYVSQHVARPRRTNYFPQPTHLSFIIAAANLHAYNYGLRGETDPAVFKRVADSVIVPEFSPKSGVKIQITENDPVNQSSSGTFTQFETVTCRS